MKILGDEHIQGVLKVSRRVVEGLKSIQIEDSYQLTNRSEKYFRFSSNNVASVKLPDALTLTNGFEFVLYSTDSHIELKDFSGNTLQHMVSGIMYYCYLVGNADSNGSWIISSDTSYDISLGSSEDPSSGVRSYFKIDKEYTGVVGE